MTSASLRLLICARVFLSPVLILVFFALPILGTLGTGLEILDDPDIILFLVWTTRSDLLQLLLLPFHFHIYSQELWIAFHLPHLTLEQPESCHVLRYQKLIWSLWRNFTRNVFTLWRNLSNCTRNFFASGCNFLLSALILRFGAQCFNCF